MIKSVISSLLLAVAVVVSPISMADVSSKMSHIEVNINTAQIEELDKYLEGVGEAKAQAIVDYRKQNGLFKSIDSLSNVKGIGEKIVDKNRSKIVL